MLDNELDDLLNDTPSVIRLEDGTKRKNLGRGLGALLGDDLIQDSQSNAIGNIVQVSDITIGKFQPRQEFDEDALSSLAESIKEKGVLQPLLVRKQNDKYELIAGERRLRASKMAGLLEVPVVIKDMSDKEVFEAALVENILREDLSAIEEAEGYQRLIADFSYTQESVSKVVGKSRPHISNTIRLLSLPIEVQKLIRDGELSAGHARALVGLENAVQLANEIVQSDMSVRMIEDLVSKQKYEAKEDSLPNKDSSISKEKKSKDSNIADIEDGLKKSLGLRIKITPSANGGGKVVLQYSSIAELDMIIDILNSEKKSVTLQSSARDQVDQRLNDDKFSIKIID